MFWEAVLPSGFFGGLKKTSTCTEHLTAGICESHKVDVGAPGFFRNPQATLQANCCATPGIQAFRCSWKASIPAGDQPAVPAECVMTELKKLGDYLSIYLSVCLSD